MLSHGNAAAFIDWSSDVFKPNEHDRFSSHAPFHFDLSILDIYVSLKHGATLVIVEEQLGKEPARLAPWIAEKKLTVWYSAPSIFSLLAQFGKLEQYDYSSLRLVLFAGEVFPIKYLKLLKSLWPHPKYSIFTDQRKPMSARFMKCGELSLIRKAKPFPSAKPVPTASHSWSMSLVSRLPRVPKESCVSRAQASWRDTGTCRKTRRRHFCQDTRNDGIVPAISFAS